MTSPSTYLRPHFIDGPLVITWFRVQYDQHFPSFSSFCDLWKTRKILPISLIHHLSQEFPKHARIEILKNWFKFKKHTHEYTYTNLLIFIKNLRFNCFYLIFISKIKQYNIETASRIRAMLHSSRPIRLQIFCTLPTNISIYKVYESLHER